MTHLKIRGMKLSLHERLHAELNRAGFRTATEPLDFSIHVQCPVNQSDIPGEIVHRVLEEDENERRAAAA